MRRKSGVGYRPKKLTGAPALNGVVLSGLKAEKGQLYRAFTFTPSSLIKGKKKRDNQPTPKLRPFQMSDTKTTDATKDKAPCGLK